MTKIHDKGNPPKEISKTVRPYGSTGNKRVEIKLDDECHEILRRLAKNSPRRITYSELIRWCIRKASLPYRSAIAKKIAEHDRKKQYWQKVLKEYEESQGPE